MNHRILITGSSGLVGSALISVLERRGVGIARLDVNAEGADHGDVRDLSRVQRAMQGCDGIIHLAAISRVIWGEQNPEACWTTNVDGLRNVIDAASASDRRPWIISASSREVYGQPETLPATEDCPVRPVNIYGRSKVEGERLIAEARHEGLRACVIRLSNVFGTTADHVDRVVPAFARGAVEGQQLRVDGADHTFDFTHIDDVARGIVSLAGLLLNGESAPPPIHFVSGTPTTLLELAAMAIELANTDSTMRLAPPRNFDVERFVGSGARAKEILAWEPKITLKEGLERLIALFRRELGMNDRIQVCAP